MKINKIVLLILMWVLNLALGHGVAWKPIEDVSQAEAVLFTYDDGSLMSFAEVKIQAPDGKAFQNGRTDRNGVFAFMPSTSGEWTLSANDGMGHLAQATLNINLAGESGAIESTVTTTESTQGPSKLIKIILIASMLINFSLIFKYFRDRKSA